MITIFVRVDSIQAFEEKLNQKEFGIVQYNSVVSI